MSRILGIDPGSRATGYGVIDAAADGTMCYLASGVVRPQRETLAGRLGEIFEGLMQVQGEFGADAAAVEQVFMRNNPDAALKLGQARGAALCACFRSGLEVAEYAPRSIKQAVVGSGGAAKEQVQYMVRTLLRLPRTPPSDAADALAVALCHAQGLRIRSRLEAAARR